MEMMKALMKVILDSSDKIRTEAMLQSEIAEGRIAVLKSELINPESILTWSNLEDYGAAQDQFGRNQGALWAATEFIEAIQRSLPD